MLRFAYLLSRLYRIRVLGTEEVPPRDKLDFVAFQVGSEAKALAGYAQRDKTRWEHLGELQNYLGVLPFQPRPAVIASTKFVQDRNQSLVAQPFRQGSYCFYCWTMAF